MLKHTIPPCPNLLIIDQLTPNKELVRVLHAMSRPGAHIPRGANLYNIFIPTLVCTAKPLSDDLFPDQAIQVVLTPNRGRLPRFDAQSAQTLREKFLCYRELNFAKVRDSDFDAPKFTSPMREVASMLGNSIVDDPTLRRCLLRASRAPGSTVRIGRTDSIKRSWPRRHYLCRTKATVVTPLWARSPRLQTEFRKDVARTASHSSRAPWAIS